MVWLFVALSSCCSMGLCSEKISWSGFSRFCLVHASFLSPWPGQLDHVCASLCFEGIIRDTVSCWRFSVVSSGCCWAAGDACMIAQESWCFRQTMESCEVCSRTSSTIHCWIHSGVYKPCSGFWFGLRNSNCGNFLRSAVYGPYKEMGLLTWVVTVCLPFSMAARLWVGGSIPAVDQGLTRCSCRLSRKTCPFVTTLNVLLVVSWSCLPSLHCHFLLLIALLHKIGQINTTAYVASSLLLWHYHCKSRSCHKHLQSLSQPIILL